MGVGICFLDPAGAIQPHRHSFEESFYILSGTAVVQIGDQSYEVGPGNYGLIATGKPPPGGTRAASHCDGLKCKPRSRVGSSMGAIHFSKRARAAVPGAPVKPQDKVEGLLGHFDESALPRPGGASQMEGFNPTTGVAIKMFVDRSFGSIHQSLFLIQYRPARKSTRTITPLRSLTSSWAGV